MAAPPSPTQVAGNHNAIYEGYYNFVDPNGHGTIGALEAARFLKKSGLSDVVLSRVWDLSDPGGRGCLDKTGMFVALKLVALAQAGRDINMSNINMDMPPPKMGDIPLPKPKKPPPPMHTPLITSLPPSAVDWTVKPSEREKYNKLFDSLQPMNGLIPGNKVKGVLMDSKLPIDTLGKIWELADQDKDGSLDRVEFIAAMHLVYKALEKYTIPNVLPSELLAQHGGGGMTGGRKYPQGNLISSALDGMRPKVPPQPITMQPTSAVAAAPPVKPQMPPAMTAPPKPLVPSMTGGGGGGGGQQPLISGLSNSSLLSSSVNTVKPVQSVAPTSSNGSSPATMTSSNITTWVVNPDDRAKFDMLFIKSDVDRDGFVSGMEIKDVFLQSGVPQPVLAHIWALCDIRQSGKLNNEQFSLAMWFVARCLKGMDPPTVLSPEMIPPSFRTAKPADGQLENNNSCFTNPELEMISKDIEELSREKLALEMDISQKEASIRVKSGEIKSLQSELDTLAATLKQLENQKGEAQKRLNDLKTQKSEFDASIAEVQTELDITNDKVDKLRIQASEQAEVISSQEAELHSKKEQLESLKQEEQRLEQLKNDNTNKLDSLSSKLQDTQLNISQAKALISQLEEQTRQMNDAISSCDTAIDAGDVSSVADATLSINPDFRDPQFTRLGMVNGETKENGYDDTSNDPFSKNSNNPATTGFSNDPFANDPFKNSSDAFGSSDHFKSAFSNNATDGFSTQDPFNNFNSTNNPPKIDPFDAFGDGQNTSVTPEPDKDPFGCDPFAVLHAPTRDAVSPGVGGGGGGGGGNMARSTSPSPALPPKKAKPPRPAPPRPQPPAFQQKEPVGGGGGGGGDPFGKPQDPFGGGSTTGGFADFADFDDKFVAPSPSITTTTVTTTTTTTTTTTNQRSSSKGLDFTDDPFREYRYEDPFNIAFEEESAFAAAATTAKPSPFPTDELVCTNSNSLGGRTSVPPVGTSRLFPASFDGSGGGRTSAPITTSEQRLFSNEQTQLAWAAQDSVTLEERRLQRIRQQEEADLKLAIALSQAENA